MSDKKVPEVKAKKPPTFNIPGQKKYSSVREAINDTSRILGELHIQTHAKIKVR